MTAQEQSAKLSLATPEKIHPMEKKTVYVEKDAHGRLQMVRKISRPRRRERRIEVIEVSNTNDENIYYSHSEDDTIEVSVCHKCGQVACKHRSRHCSSSDSASCSDSENLVTVSVNDRTRVEVRNSRTTVRATSRLPSTYLGMLFDSLTVSSKPSHRHVSHRHSDRRGETKIYVPVDKHIKLERVPVVELCRSHTPPRKVEEVKVERWRPERPGDFDSECEPYHHRRHSHGRVLHRDYSDYDIPEIEKVIETEDINILAPERRKDRAFVEHEVYDVGRNAFVLKRVPKEVRFAE